jgi:hypothetical protein
MTKLKLTSVAIITAVLAASAPTGASAKMTVVVPGQHFGTGAGPWPIFVCAGGIITAALVANARDNRELTAPEAWTCGLKFWFTQPRNGG